MEKRVRERLCFHYDAIVQELNTDRIILYMSQTVLSEHECNKISTLKLEKDRAKRLLDILMSKGPELPVAYHKFRYALMEHYPHLVRKLDSECITPEYGSTGVSKKIVFKRRDSLILNLKTEGVLEVLEKGGILSKEDCYQVKAGMTKEDKARVLVNMIPERGPAAYRQFKLAVKAHQPKLAELLE